MNTKELIKKEIERKCMDGLYCSDVPCGCLKDDLAPCGTDDFESCEMGKKMIWEADEECGCDSQGSKHWHICAPNYQKPTEKKVNK